MAGTATAATGASAQSQQPAPESPEVVAARAKANDAGFARNRAEAAYNAAKKEKGGAEAADQEFRSGGEKNQGSPFADAGSQSDGRQK